MMPRMQGDLPGTFTQSDWVQSYGSHYVRPPLIYGDVSRPVAMTVEWAKFAQSKTDKPMKGMPPALSLCCNDHLCAMTCHVPKSVARSGLIRIAVRKPAAGQKPNRL